MRIQTIYGTGWHNPNETVVECLGFIDQIIHNYNKKMIDGFYLQPSDDSDWEAANIYTVLEAVIPAKDQYTVFGLDAYRIGGYWIMANPDKDFIVGYDKDITIDFEPKYA